MTTAPTLDLPTFDVRHGDPSLVRDLVLRPGVLEYGHYALLSGRHSETFIRFSRLARDEDALNCIADWLTPSLKPWDADAVVAPSTAGVALGWTLARRLSAPLHLAAPGTDGRTAAISTTHDLNGQRVLLVNDIVTTGAGMAALAHVVEAAGGEIAGAAWFASRSHIDIKEMIRAPGVCVVTVELGSVDAADCDLCQREITVERAIELN